MKAVRQHQYGGPEVLQYEDAPDPTLQGDEVLVKVHATGVNPVDWKSRYGRGMGDVANPFPLILGWDISGTVAATNTPDFEVGAAVFGMVRFPGIGSAYAEYVAAPKADLALKPHNIDHIQAAAIPLAALTAWQVLFESANLQPGQRVLIHAAAGGVGHLAVQLAKWKGTTVIGTASAHNREFLEQLGVDQFVDYREANVSEVIEPVDVVIDNVGGETLAQSYRLVKPGGRLVSIAGRPDPAEAAARDITATRILVRPVAEHLAAIAQLMGTGLLKPEIAAVLPLSEAAQAHRLSEAGHTRGKIVLEVN